MLLSERLGPPHLGFTENYIKERAPICFLAASNKNIRDSSCDEAVIAHRMKMTPT